MRSRSDYSSFIYVHCTLYSFWLKKIQFVLYRFWNERMCKGMNKYIYIGMDFCVGLKIDVNEMGCEGMKMCVKEMKIDVKE